MARSKSILLTWTEYIVAMNGLGNIFKRRYNCSDESIQKLKYKVNQAVEEFMKEVGIG